MPDLLIHTLPHYPSEIEELPQYATEGAACFDIRAALPVGEDWPLHVGRTIKIPTGLQFVIPEGYALLIYSRSGHGFNNSVRLCNCVGVIDSDYRGELFVGMTADSQDQPLAMKLRMQIKRGDRIAQGMLIELPKSVALCKVHDYTQYETKRGGGGFGSTGVK